MEWLLLYYKDFLRRDKMQVIGRKQFQTKAGVIEGIEFDTCYELRGVRYATAQRWTAPKMVKNWDGVYDASEYGKRCFQHHWTMDEFYGKEFYTDSSFEVPESEDCLFMTITIPKAEFLKTDEKRYPIAIWYHGGGFVNGWGTEAEFSGEPYAKRGVILVRVNERLNIFGSFYHEELVKRDGICGNYQLMDHIAALDFVRYIADDLGGDLNRISIFGQSAGGMGVEQMICSPYIKGKVSGAIFQSGFTFCVASRPQGSMQVAILASQEYLKSKKLTFEEIEQMPAEQLYALSDEYLEFLERYGVGYSAVIDGDYMRETCEDAILNGRIPNIPYLLGCCSGDGRMGDGEPQDGPFYQSMALFCKVLQSQGKRGYLYLFDRNMPGDDAGAFHAADLWYVFGTLKNSWRPFDRKDEELSERMIDAWAEFFKTGKPDHENWPAYTNEMTFTKKWNVE